MKSEHSDLWRRLCAFTPDDPASAFSFTARLARDNGWTLDHARRVVEEYRRFAFLAVAAGHPVTPSDAVDQAWHLHLLYTRSYWDEFCRGVLGVPLHHGPTRGGASERAKFGDWYARTIRSYTDHFGHPPPPDVWPLPEQRFGEDLEFVRVNRARAWIVTKPRWWGVLRRWSGRRMGVRGRRRVPVLLLAAGILAGTVAWRLEEPLRVAPPASLILFLGIWAGVHGLAFLCRRRLACPPASTRGEPSVSGEADPFAAAYLAGKGDRLVQAALLRGASLGAVVFNEEQRTWHRVADLSGDAQVWERRVHEAIAPEGSTRQALVERIREPLEAFARALEAEEWVVRQRRASLARVLPSLLAWTVPLLGFAKVMDGARRDLPVGVLTLLTVGSAIAAVAFGLRPHRTRRGDAVLEWMRLARGDAARGGARSGDASMAVLAVALFGTGALQQTRFEALGQQLNAGDPQGHGGCGGGGDGGCGGCGGCG